MAETKNKLYLCLGDNGALTLETRQEVDSWLSAVEEGQGAINQTVVGAINLDETRPYFFVIFKMDKSIIYDVIAATNEEDARITIASKKRYAKRLLEFKRVHNISELIAALKN